MTAKKKFDCVKMKWEIQQALDAEYSCMPADTVKETQDAKLRSNPLLRGFLDGRKGKRRTHVGVVEADS